jgi:hypothetical protein
MYGFAGDEVAEAMARVLKHPQQAHPVVKRRSLHPELRGDPRVLGRLVLTPNNILMIDYGN